MKHTKLRLKLNSQIGQASRLLLVLAIVVLVAVVITFLIIRMAEKPPKPDPTPVNPVVQPFYETILGNIRFVFVSAIDRGNVLRATEITPTQYPSGSQKDMFAQSGGKFIQVTVGAQNKGTMNIEQGAWDIENIVDSQNREFVASNSYTVGPWLPIPNPCGALLKPEFDPAPCVKIYEVSKASTGLKIRVKAGKNNTASNFASGRVDSFLLDLITK